MSLDEDRAEVLFRAKLQRQDSTSWGFRLQGGLEYDTPLTLLKVLCHFSFSLDDRCFGFPISAVKVG